MRRSVELEGLPPVPTNETEAREAIRALVRTIGYAFHPDTEGMDYVAEDGSALFSAAQEDRYAAIIDHADFFLDDIYEVAIEALETIEKEGNSPSWVKAKPTGTQEPLPLYAPDGSIADNAVGRIWREHLTTHDANPVLDDTEDGCCPSCGDTLDLNGCTSCGYDS